MMKPTPDQIKRIKKEVEQAAWDHLEAKDAVTALGHFSKDIIAVSNDKIFPDYDALAEDVREYYDLLKEINLAVWDEMHISVFHRNEVLVTARFSYSFTDINDQQTDLKGVWTALYQHQIDGWKIRMRHETFREK